MTTSFADERLHEAMARIRRFLDHDRPDTPCLVIDLPTVRDRFAAIRAALPRVGIFYAVKANPTPDVVGLLAAEGSSFDVASPAEIDLCLARGAAPEAISYSNPIKKARDVAYAYGRGVRLFVSDSEQDVRVLAEHAPGASVLLRILVDSSGSTYPFGKKFGCSPEMATDLLRLAAELGLVPLGVAFHAGSQQLDPNGWDGAIADAAVIIGKLRAEGLSPTTVNLGGGLPAGYLTQPPPLAEYAAAITASIARHFGDFSPEVMIEPGRAIVAESGLIRSEVVLVSRKSYSDEHRWVFLDIGRYGGLAETEGEAIAYPLVTSRDGVPQAGAPVGPVVLAGPTCDADDVLYQNTCYELPLDLRAGDHVDLLGAGAYTASYSSVAFNGFPPLATHCVR
ncbi:ornithine decarboxylase [Saccharothrix sp. NRRL B-16348]|uniref:type III PLP-dependent enzyme n=1 Tax=Saccharothrix sp. NRRL B-16348 TaxID=1415542 RepID=UPI0006ADCC5B|nr:type III PLP-dependent enzyme [Saccharothrix sp. NRRL B-16348]KOX15580.1 ornithine decarboxylase [Saccharothrix sp. NRRL B-16348]